MCPCSLQFKRWKDYPVPYTWIVTILYKYLGNKLTTEMSPAPCSLNAGRITKCWKDYPVPYTWI